MSSDPLNTVEKLQREPCDVLFPDVEMPDRSGFEMLTQVEPGSL
jgi:DNA-binding LytR/AlgR family response regulator